MGRFEFEQARVVESCSPLRHHSRNRKNTKRTLEGEHKYIEVPKKVASAGRKRSRRFVQALGKVRGLIQGTPNPLDSPVSRKDLRYLKNAITIVDPLNKERPSVAEILEALHFLGNLARNIYNNESTIGTVGHVLLRSSRQTVVINSWVYQDMEESIDFLKEQGVNIEVKN